MNKTCKPFYFLQICMDDRKPLTFVIIFLLKILDSNMNFFQYRNLIGTIYMFN